MQNARLDEAQAGIKTARRNINNLRYADDTTLTAESEEELWGCRIVWCILTSIYLVSLLPVSIIHVSDIFLVGF